MSSYTTAWALRQSPVNDVQFRALIWLSEMGGDDGWFATTLERFAERMQCGKPFALSVVLSLADLGLLTIAQSKDETVLAGKMKVDD